MVLNSSVVVWVATVSANLWQYVACNPERLSAHQVLHLIFCFPFRRLALSLSSLFFCFPTSLLSSSDADDDSDLSINTTRSHSD